MAILPATRAESWASDENKEQLNADVLEKGSQSTHGDAPQPSIWKRVLAGGASDGNETKRAMQSRHLTMIGQYTPSRT